MRAMNRPTVYCKDCLYRDLDRTCHKHPPVTFHASLKGNLGLWLIVMEDGWCADGRDKRTGETNEDLMSTDIE